jgi:Na+/phosphate symporter
MSLALDRENNQRIELEKLADKQRKQLDTIQEEIHEARKAKEDAVSEARSSLELLEDFLERHQKLLGNLKRQRESITTKPTT